MAGIKDLTAELVSLVVTLPEFVDKGFAIFDLDDLQSIANLEAPPVVGVAYEGGGFVDNQGNPVGNVRQAASLYRVQFSIIIAVPYDGGNAFVDTKPTATDLLDATRGVVLGYKGVNTRPWRFNGEGPLDGVLEGVIFYGQVWETELPVVNNA